MNRRFRQQRPSLTRILKRKLVTFQLGQEKYAIAIERVQRVLHEFTPHGVLTSGQSLIAEGGQTITIVDLATFFVSSEELRARHYLMICTLANREIFGIPVPEIPKVVEVLETEFSEVPALYRQGNYPAAIEKIICLPENQVIFYLNIDLLFPKTVANGSGI
jgi:purine-binding chemotaxis protein CheW